MEEVVFYNLLIKCRLWLGIVTFINLVMEISSLLPLLPSLIVMFSIYFLAALVPIDYSFILLLGEIWSLEGKEWRRIPSSSWDRVSELNSDKALYSWELVFIMGRILGLFHNGYCPLFLCQPRQNLTFSLWGADRVPWGKFTKVWWGPLRQWP